MSILRHQITGADRRTPYYETPQQIHDQDGLEYRVIHDDEYPQFYYHLEHRKLFRQRDTELDSWRLDTLSLEDHVSSCHFILAINQTFNTEFVCADGGWECSDSVQPCEVRE